MTRKTLNLSKFDITIKTINMGIDLIINICLIVEVHVMSKI